MTSFDQREHAFEAAYQHNQEMQFKARARRNKLLGLWAAGLLGKSGADAEAYARTIVLADFEKPGDHDMVLRSLQAHLAKRFASIEFVDVMPGRGLRWGDHPEPSITELAREARIDAAIVTAGC